MFPNPHPLFLRKLHEEELNLTIRISQKSQFDVELCRDIDSCDPFPACFGSGFASLADAASAYRHAAKSSEWLVANCRSSQKRTRARRINKEKLAFLSSAVPR